MQSKFDSMGDEFLKLQNQICYRLYLASNGLMRLYKPLLAPLGLTYPQYILMLSLWEEDHITMGQLAAATSMDKGFLSALVKSLEAKGLIQVARDAHDSRKKRLILNKRGQKLKEKAQDIPKTLLCMLGGDRERPEEIAPLKSMLDELNRTIAGLEKNETASHSNWE
jgi:DNA-binding MarR family transcriptional regulator